MKRLRGIIGQNLLGIAVALGLVSFVIEFLILHSQSFIFTKCTAALMALAAAFEKRRDESRRNARLKKKGLSVADLQNIEFVKTWSALRSKGIYRYCFFEGGLVTGLVMMLPIALIGMLSFNDISSLFSDPIRMLLYTFYCTMIGYVLGAALYLLRWVLSEKRFLTLTDPLR